MSIHTSAKDSPALRMGVARSVNAVDFRPAGMAPSAILYVRKLVGRLPADAVLGATHRGNAQWQVNLKDQLEQAYRRAERPVAGRVSASARAVLFRDRGELLACLCRDALDGTLAGKWWWTASDGPLFYSLPRSAAIRSALSSAPEQLPAVFAQLADWKLAISLVERLDDGDANTLIGALLVELACPRLLEKLEETTPPRPKVGGPEAAPRRYTAFRGWLADGSDRRYWHGGSVHGTDRRLAEAGSGQSPYPPWLPLFGDQVWERRLSRSRACLLGLARTAFARPALLRNAVFESQVAVWWSAAQSAVGQEEPAEDVPGIRASVADREHSPAPGAGEAARKQPAPVRVKPSGSDFGSDEGGDHPFGDASSYPRERPHPADSGSHPRDVPVALGDPGAPGLEDGEAHPSQTPEIDAGPAHSYANPGDRPDGAGNDPYARSDARADRQAANGNDSDEAFDAGVGDPRPNWLTDNYVDTELGGLLYLVNLLEQLELPESMDADWHFEARLGRWEFLELMARSLLSECLERLENDVVWCLLAKLSGRQPDAPIGESYPPGFAPDYRLPPDWWAYLKSSTDGPLPLWWAVQADRMRVWCDECILIDRAIDTDCPQDPEALLASVQALLRPYREDGELLPVRPGTFGRAPREQSVEALDRALGDPLRRWASMALPFVRRFLQRQLHLESATGDRLLETLLALPARIYFTPSHIDMVADVDLTSLVIRRAGLDQDPGWQPLYGRVLLFHFAHV